MGSLKKLAGQTIWYGLSNIASKLLNQILTPIITYLLNSPSGMVDYGNYSMLYACISFANIIYTYGLETAYFRFSATGTNKFTLFQTTFSSLIISSVLLSTIILLYRASIANFIGIGGHSEYIIWCVLIISIDTLAAIPFARLRQEGRPKKYAFVRMGGILVNIFLTIFFMQLCPRYVAEHPGSAFAQWYNGNTSVGFLILANLFQAAFTFLLLAKEWMSYRFGLDRLLLKKILAYSWPMVIGGLGGMVNETIDRLMLPKLYVGTAEEKKIALSIYAANYKISIFITLFIQAFRMSAEPFFFSQAADRNATATYARVMKWFVLTLCVAFLFTALYIDVWKYFIGSQYRSGLGVVPILLAANVALGIYYNLSVWYKLSDKMHLGMLITVIGAIITLVSNWLFIPTYGMYACAWTTLAAYATMMVVCYAMGQHYFPVNYGVRRLLGYLGTVLVLFLAQKGIMMATNAVWAHLLTGTLFMGVFMLLVVRNERAELANLPKVGRFFRR
jgi:O-antigen/teichoic acid export membrane protein